MFSAFKPPPYHAGLSHASVFVQLFQLAVLLALQHSRPGLQAALADNPWTGREQERLRIFDLLEVDLPVAPHDYLKVLEYNVIFVFFDFALEEIMVLVYVRRTRDSHLVPTSSAAAHVFDWFAIHTGSAIGQS